MILFLFGVMLTRAVVGRETDLNNKNWALGIPVALLMLGVMAYVLIKGFGDDHLDPTNQVSTAELSDSIFKPFLLPFEALSFVLLAAVIGAKGGAGTTTVAVNCGVEIARRAVGVRGDFRATAAAAFVLAIGVSLTRPSSRREASRRDVAPCAAGRLRCSLLRRRARPTAGSGFRRTAPPTAAGTSRSSRTPP